MKIAMNKRPRLGRGLDALLGGGDAPPSKEELKQIPVERLKRGKYQPRTHMRPEALAELAESIKAQGVVQPLVVRPVAGGDYEIVAGERRWRAAQMAGLAAVPAVVREIPDEAAIAVALIENIQRENLNPVEEAAALSRLIEEFGMTHQRVAEGVGRSRATVTNLLRLLSLDATVRAMLEDGRMDMGHARALLALPARAQVDAARQVVERGLSVRQTEALVRRLLEAGTAHKDAARPALDPNVRALQDSLSERLGARVRLQHRADGGGKLTIEYHSNDELEGILKRFA